MALVIPSYVEYMTSKSAMEGIWKCFGLVPIESTTSPLTSNDSLDITVIPGSVELPRHA